MNVRAQTQIDRAAEWWDESHSSTGQNSSAAIIGSLILFLLLRRTYGLSFSPRFQSRVWLAHQCEQVRRFTIDWTRRRTVYLWTARGANNSRRPQKRGPLYGANADTTRPHKNRRRARRHNLRRALGGRYRVIRMSYVLMSA